jgi:hypothetical protein
MSIERIIDIYCDAWSDPDPGSRARLLASVWSEAATYTDPTVDRLDRAGLLDHVERVQRTRPGARVVRSTDVESHHGCARFGFRVVDADGVVLREGTDFVLLTTDCQRIDRIVGFFEAASAPPERRGAG